VGDRPVGRSLIDLLGTIQHLEAFPILHINEVGAVAAAEDHVSNIAQGYPWDGVRLAFRRLNSLLIFRKNSQLVSDNHEPDRCPHTGAVRYQPLLWRGSGKESGHSWFLLLF
jgi:hypothetical protein